MATETLDVEELRQTHYNARVERIWHVHDELFVLRVRPDGEPPDYEPGQYTLLGLGAWERRCDAVPPTDEHRQKLIRRAYSMSCPLLDEQGRLIRCADSDFLEFFISVIHKPSDTPPSLTPRLAALQEGDPIFLGPHPHGHYTIEPLQPDDDVVLAATGAGEAPHNAMIAELLARGHTGRITVVTCVRYRKDLAYAEAHRKLETLFPNYRYLTLNTREPENLDASRSGFVGKRHLQDYFASGDFESDAGWRLDPDNSHVYLCGNPSMIGFPRRDRSGESVYPEPIGMIEMLVHRGFRLDEPHQPGNIHFEKW